MLQWNISVRKQLNVPEECVCLCVFMCVCVCVCVRMTTTLFCLWNGALLKIPELVSRYQRQILAPCVVYCRGQRSTNNPIELGAGGSLLVSYRSDACRWWCYYALLVMPQLWKGIIISCVIVTPIQTKSVTHELTSLWQQFIWMTPHSLSDFQMARFPPLFALIWDVVWCQNMSRCVSRN